MPSIISTDRPVMWAVKSGADILVADVMEVGGLTVTGLELVSDTDENAFLGKVAGSAGSYLPLPNVGEWLEAGKIYAYNSGLVIVRQSHFRTLDAPETVPNLFLVYRADATEALDWVANEPVLVGTRRMFGGVLYECLQAHTTQVDSDPASTVGVLWQVVATTPEWTIGVFYHIGDIVLYVPNGIEYRCIQAHTAIATYSPVSPGILGLLWVLA